MNNICNCNTPDVGTWTFVLCTHSHTRPYEVSRFQWSWIHWYMLLFLEISLHIFRISDQSIGHWILATNPEDSKTAQLMHTITNILSGQQSYMTGAFISLPISYRSNYFNVRYHVIHIRPSHGLRRIRAEHGISFANHSAIEEVKLKNTLRGRKKMTPLGAYV